MNRFTILLGGELTVTPRLRAQIAETCVIAADSGMRHAAALGVEPELWAGDFDSSSETLQARYTHVPRAEHPREKDMTDGEIAIEAARERGAAALVIAGVFGGERTDHAFLHLAVGMRMAEAGVEVLLTSGTTEGRPLLPGKAGFDFAPGTTFSVIGFDDLTGLTLRGVKWPLDRRHVPFGSSLTISNEVTGALEASLERGRAMVVAHLPESGER
jgi:thiamine pyrophosphokinase